MTPGPLQSFVDLRKTISAERVGDGGDDVCVALTAALDAGLAGLGADLGSGVAVVALGGYGRGEQCLGSDVDVMLLHTTTDPEPFTRQVLYPLWDADLKVGHSVRTVAENQDQAAGDFESLTSLLSARLVVGDPNLYDEFEQMLTALIRTRPLASALAAAERERRQTDPYPSMTTDVKAGRGGLRTHHGFWWERRRAEMIGLPVDEISPQENQARRNLLRIRNALHAAAGRAEDRFLVDLREPAAQWLGSDVMTLATEFTAAMNVGDRLADRRWPDLHAEADPMLSFGRRVFGAVKSRFSTNREDHPEDRPLAIAVKAASRPEGAFLTREEATLIETSPPTPWTDSDRDDFIRLLAAGARGRTVFGQLRALGWVEREMPEWSVVATAPQLAPFHDHPVGTHLWRTVDEIEALVEDPGEPGRVAAALGSTEELLLSAFLHDIGKARGGNHSEVGAEVAAVMLRRMGFGAATSGVVVDCIRHHLLLSETATRRDPADLDVINEVADLVGDVRRLDVLYLLTIADLRATGTSMWNEWRSTLIRGLYHRVREAIGAGGAQPITLNVAAVATVAPHGVALRQIEEHVAAMPRGYLDSTSPGDVLWHMKLLDELAGPAVIASRPDDPSHVAVAGADRSGFLLAVIRAFTANGIGIFEARLRTREDGLTLDTFRVATDRTGQAVPEDRWSKVRTALLATLAGDKDLRPEIRERVATYRKESGGETSVRVRVEARFTVVEVRAPDRIGLLNDIVTVLHGDGLDVHLANIDTMGGEARDTFHVRRIGGIPVRDQAELDSLRDRLEDALRG